MKYNCELMYDVLSWMYIIISETQENTMNKDKGVVMTAQEVNKEIEILKTVFDIVRLVPAKTE